MSDQRQFEFLPDVPRSEPVLKRFGAKIGTRRHSFETLSRSIHYLGSKLRIRNWVTKAIDYADPSGGTVCDLFCGSGTVANALAGRRNVIAVDIQEYSRILCTALLGPGQISQADTASMIDRAKNSEHTEKLVWAFKPMCDYEQSCLDGISTASIDRLCDFLEHASFLQAYRFGCDGSSDLRKAIAATIDRLTKADLLLSAETVITRYYGGVYFSYLQAVQIDALLEAISALHVSEKKSVLLAALMGTASDIVNTVGKQFAQPIRPRKSDGSVKPHLSKRVRKDRLKDVFAEFKKWANSYAEKGRIDRDHQVWKMDYREALDKLRSSVSVIYADPPYTRDHYSRYYHVLETIALRDCPNVSTTRVSGSERISRGIYRTDRHQSPFCIKSQAVAAFKDLISGARTLEVPLVLSYSPFESGSDARPRLMTIEQLQRLASAEFRDVEVWSAEQFSHNKLNRSELNKRITYGAEQLLICKP
jgi:adenine-specific DNA methylase